MSAPCCTKCGRELYHGAILSGDSLCSLCWSGARGATKPVSAGATPKASGAVASPATNDPPPGPPSPPPWLDGDEAATAERIAAMANGHAPFAPSTVPDGRDEETTTAARIAAIANGAARAATNSAVSP